MSFFGSDLSGSIFTNVCIDACNFNFCNLSNTIWDKIILKEKPYLEGRRKKFLDLAFSNDEKLLASAD